MGMQRDFIALALYFIVLIGLWIRFKGKRLSRFLIWTGIFMLLYFCILEIQNRTFFILIPLFFLLLFCYFYFKEKCRLRNGWLFNLMLISFMGYVAIVTATNGSLIGAGILAILAVLFLIVILFGLYAAIIFLIGNSFIVLRHESRRLPNLLTLILALAIIALIVMQIYGPKILPNWSVILLSIPTTIAFYFFVVFWNFLSISIIYQFNQPKFNQDYIVVLGAGLIGGEKVTPLLAKRIDRAIQFYKKQSEETLSPPQLLMSGGQGPDEKIPEAQAMREYALEQGIPDEDILMEAQSTNTLENMRFSKEIMERENPSGYHAIFTSNNYHIFRAGMYAEEVGLKIDGIGSKTARYYLPNAFLREFIAVALMNKRLHLFVCGLIALGFIALAVINYFFIG
ncbi:YdcF family protein [Enterococcus raffinosus]|uniref:YdcF family protein n=1 Tax=Enterococcus raffinosus TaxID=71452 RepID=A0AAW8T527_9ENTE|nr:YdcF family protein [Enterococcus raffinosus]MDT2522110.1 YdcF family protein [Enterococcus raffinosus]MDT2528454.1 YdcF family protein [Enterococcus raffinosus]MDT2533079.1 YdcF family protein [Enterococcus raffinosus]MDT2543519.1 YdcF family protein [Enterococcus raffinosus]MDT2553633.1 YdcF family protein [Enterococcus raffinosus]